MIAFHGTVAASNARRVLRHGQSRGLALAGPPAEASRIPAGQMFDIWSRLVRGLGAPDLPITIARDFKLEDLDLLGLVILTAPTGKQALETWVRYSALLNDGRTWEIFSDKKRIELRFTDACPRVLGVRLSHETAFAQLVRGAAQLTDEAPSPISVSFRHAAPADIRAHRALFQSELLFGAEIDRVVFARDAFECTPRWGNLALWRYLRTHADAALAHLAPRPLAERVHDEVVRAVAEGLVPEMTSIATSLGTTERTLRRCLASAGTTFRQLVDGARRDRARELLEASSSSVTRIAFDAGFSDASAFSHACRRWFGRSPTQVARARDRRRRSA